MEREEVKKILIILEVAYPNFEVAVEKKRAMVDLWDMLLKDYSYQEIELAVKTYISSSGSGFAPSVSQLIAMTHKVDELTALSDGEAWMLVRKAISNSSYHSKEEFEKLPENVKKAVGSPEQLYYWAIDDDYNDGVVMSNFQRAYNTVVKRELEEEKMPSEVRLQIEMAKSRMKTIGDRKDEKGGKETNLLQLS